MGASRVDFRSPFGGLFGDILKRSHLSRLVLCALPGQSMCVG